MKKILKKSVVPVLVCLFAFSVCFMSLCFNDNQAEAYELNWWWLTDNGGHLDYDHSTDYTKALSASIKVWNNHKSGVIRPDKWYRIQDVFVSDYDDSSSDAAVAYCNIIGRIKLNEHYFDTMTDNQRQKTVMHELGHALGLDENNGVTGSIMRQGIRAQTTLHQDDKNGYDASYARHHIEFTWPAS